jgi:type IV pilus assembly protein PilA
MNSPNIPPPMPTGGPSYHQRSTQQPPSKSNKTVLLAVGIGCLVMMIPIFGILLAIALPAYNDYTLRAKTAETLNSAAVFKLYVADHVANSESGDCLDMESLLQEPGQQALVNGELSWAGAYEDGACGFEIALKNADPKLNGKTVAYYLDADGSWDCTGGDLANIHRIAECRAP